MTGLTLLLFHLANAALLPMLSMRVAAAPASVNPGVFAAATVIISQAVMIPVAIRPPGESSYGYWRLIMLALLIMPVRAALAASTDAPFMMIPVQILDGLAAGIRAWWCRHLSWCFCVGAGTLMPGRAWSC